MQPTKPEVKQLNFFDIFKDNFDDKQIYEVGQNERVIVNIHCPKFDVIDEQIFKTILMEGQKELTSDRVSCRIEAATLMERLGIIDTVLYERLMRILSFRLEVTTKYSNSHYTFFDLAINSLNDKHVAYELGIYNVAVLKKHFDNNFIDLLN